MPPKEYPVFGFYFMVMIGCYDAPEAFYSEAQAKLHADLSVILPKAS